MSIVINDPELERDLIALAAERGQSVEEVVRRSLDRTRHDPDGQRSVQNRGAPRQAASERVCDLPAWLRELQLRYRQAVVDPERTEDELLGYDEHGLPS